MYQVRNVNRRLVVAVIVLLLSSYELPGAMAANKHFLLPGQAFSLKTKIQKNGHIQLHWKIASGYYLYRQRFKVSGSPAPVASVNIPSGKVFQDPVFGRERIFTHAVTITVLPGQAEHLHLSWQGCAKAGLCYPPQHKTVDLSKSVSVTPPKSHGNAHAHSSPANKQGNGQVLAVRLSGNHTFLTLAAFFGFGLLLVFTPCVLPMVPILTSLIVGSEARGRRGLSLSIAYTLPMAVTYALLGVAAALAGTQLQAWAQNPWLLSSFAFIFVLLALSMLGVYELQVPAGFRHILMRASNRQKGGSVVSAAIMGSLSALLVGPCVTAPLASALLYIAHNGNIYLGGGALFALGLGMGVPPIIAGTLGAHLLPKPGPWLIVVKSVFGFVMLAMAIWFVMRIAPDNVTLALWGAWLIALSVTCVSGISSQRTATRMTVRTTGLLMGLWGTLLIIGAAGGSSSPIQPLSFLSLSSGQSVSMPKRMQDSSISFKPVPSLSTLKHDLAIARNRNRWTMLDFYADWCVSCHTIDRTVFGSSKVQQAVAHMQLLRANVTQDDKADRKLMKKLGVVGPPTILFIGPDGNERRNARVVGEVGAKGFLKHLHRARSD